MIERGRRVLDASVIIAAQRGSRRALDVLAEATAAPEKVILPTIALLEVRSGSRVPEKWRVHLADLQDACEVVPLDEEAARLGGRIARKLAQKGKTLRSADAAVAGCGALHGASVILTADRDFDALRGEDFGQSTRMMFTIECVEPK